MDTRHIHFIRAVADCGSVSAASRRLGLTQSALTKIVARVEDELGAHLFDRGAQGMRVNQYGELFLERTRSVGMVIEDLSAELRTMKSGISGRVRVGCGRAWLSSILPAAISQSYAAHPKVEIDIRHDVYEALRQELRRGELDFVLAQVREGTDNTDLSVEPVRTNRTTITVRREHPLTAHSGVLSAHDLTEYHWIMPPDGDPTRSYVTNKMIEAGAPPPVVQVQAVSYQLTARVLLQTDLLSLLPNYQRHIYGGSLVPLNTPWCVPEKRAGIVTLRGRSLSGASLNMLQLVRENARRQER